jgi:polyphosphate kinase 2 (PPK2 family)
MAAGSRVRTKNNSVHSPNQEREKMKLKVIKLNDYPTVPDAKFSIRECRKEMKIFHDSLFELQNVFYAGHRYALLIIFQAMDTAGKDGSIRHVMSCMNPMGVQVTSFKQPSAEELEHDFFGGSSGGIGIMQ